jgi:hypothetical protein
MYFPAKKLTRFAAFQTPLVKLCTPIYTKRTSHTSWTSFLHMMTTVPVSSRPRRPARPAICTYSPGSRLRKEDPSCLRTLSNTTCGCSKPFAEWAW